MQAKSYRTLSVAFFLILLKTTLLGQTVFWSEDFSNGIPNGWANYEVFNQIAQWDWSDDPTALLYAPQPAFGSATAQNGFAFFDSDIYNQNHDARLETTAINCTNQSSVILHFENQYDYFNPQAQALLSVSTDSFTWSPYSLFLNHLPNAHQTPVQIVELDISAEAANEATVYLRWQWIGNEEYIWRIDDVRLQTTFTPPIVNDIALEAIAIAPNFKTPLAHVQPIELGGEVHNRGVAVAHNLVFKTTIINASSGITLYSDSATAATLNPNATTILSMPTLFTPIDTGNYEIQYEIYSDSADQVLWNNYNAIPFEIVGDLFQKNFDLSITYANAGGNAYEVGNLFMTRDSGYYADKIFFNCEKDQLLGPLLGSTVDVKLYEIKASVPADFNNFNNNDAVLVAFNSYAFTASDASREEYSVEIYDANAAKYLLKPNTRYFTMVAFSNAGNSNAIRIGLDDSWGYDFAYATVVKMANNWALLGFGGDYTALVKLSVTKTNPVTRFPKTLNSLGSKILLHPNPVADGQLSVFLDLDNNSTGKLTITNEIGQIIKIMSLEDIYPQKMTINTQHLATGVYFISVQTTSGLQISKRFVVE